MDVKIRFENVFKDGSILGSKNVRVNEEIIVPEELVPQIRRSGGIVTIVEKVVEKSIPPSEPEPKVERKANAKS